VRQVPDEPDGVAERECSTVGGAGLADCRVQGGEQGVLHQDTGPGEPVEHAGLARVGVPGDGHRGHLTSTTDIAFDVTRGTHVPELTAQLGDLVVDTAAVGLDLGLTGTTQTHATVTSASGLPGQRVTPAAQSWQQVVELGEFDLGLALAASGVLGEDVQDEGGAVDDLDIHHVLQLDQLARGEFPVADDGVGTGRGDDVTEFGGLALTDVGGRVRFGAALGESFQDQSACGFGQGCELGERVGGLFLCATVPHTDEDDTFQAQGPVLDLGDIGEFGGQPPDTA